MKVDDALMAVARGVALDEDFAKFNAKYRGGDRQAKFREITLTLAGILSNFDFEVVLLFGPNLFVSVCM